MNQENNNEQPGSGSPLSIVLAALCVLVLLSVLPWSEITGNRFKDFSLFSEILDSKPVTAAAEVLIDPALAEALKEDAADRDTVAAAAPDTLPVAVVQVAAARQPASRVDGHMVIEDFSNGEAPARLRACASAGTLRCAMIGDSYIEGDILSGSVRESLHGRFGGAGVGYVPLVSAVSGFRRTVRMSSEGFRACDIRHDRLDSLHTLPGEYFRAETGAKATYKGERGGKTTSSWSRSRVMFLASSSGCISTSLDGSSWIEHKVEASENIQCIEVGGRTDRFDLRCDVPGLVLFGVWLDSPAGATFDCMSLRGYSGISHRSLGIATARELAAWNDYNLIVVEYGMNALSAEQADYSAYGSIMKRVLLRLKACYPSAAILMLGVGDRGQKQGTEVMSMPTVATLVEAQRRAAREAGVMFWDTREAMGGTNSIVDWRERGLVNADYIHLNHKGGREMARLFVESLNRVLDE